MSDLVPSATPSRARVTGPRARAVAAIVLAVVVGGCGSSAPVTHRSSTTTSSTTRPPASSTTAPIADAVLAAPLLPLFPFQTEAEARAWQSADPSTRPDYTDPGATALAFARFLGYTEIDRVVGNRRDSAGQHVDVGAVVPDTERVFTAATVHLVRYLPGADAPWEVVGTDDTTLTVSRPASGAAVASPLVVSGRISGIDESISVHVQQLHANGLLGERCCVPAGGTGSPWSTTVTFAPPTDPVLVVSASTGGHIRAVERFVALGVRNAT